jgi:hypothetical protein
MLNKDKPVWEKPELIIFCQSEIKENLLGSTGGSTGDCYDTTGDGIPDTCD